MKGPILCLAVRQGWQDLAGKSIAKATGGIMCGGVRDEAEIRGHRRTYIDHYW